MSRLVPVESVLLALLRTYHLSKLQRLIDVVVPTIDTACLQWQQVVGLFPKKIQRTLLAHDYPRRERKRKTLQLIKVSGLVGGSIVYLSHTQKSLSPVFIGETTLLKLALSDPLFVFGFLSTILLSHSPRK